MDEAFQRWIAQQERVTLYRSEDEGLWFVEWFNLKAKFNWKSNTNLQELIEEVIKIG